ncbi:tripartite tricarboxylate transporter substrate-binding protein [Rhodovarius sp.]|uniref:tripartite tricarboxylate transporter substrate-binding protein n=1 Tax=Rhodovarius sp. TaxID=2972673 RepID=UPI00333EBECC
MRRCLTLLTLLLAGPALAQFPERSITLVAAGAAGGPTDTITRILADAMAPHLGQAVVVEAIGGSVVGPGRVAQARPDGYTLLVNNIGMAASATLFRRLPYDVPNAFAPLGLVSEAAMTIVTRPGFPGPDLAGVMATLKARGDAINMASAGISSASNLCALLVQHAAGAQATVVVFRGTAPAITEMMSGRLDILCDQATNTVPYIRDNRVVPWGVSSPARLPGLPQVPTTAEAGFPSIAMSTWHGLYAPAGTPEAVQERLSAALRAALREERLRRRFADLLTDVPDEARSTTGFHTRFLREEIDRWRPIIQAAGQFAD